MITVYVKCANVNCTNTVKRFPSRQKMSVSIFCSRECYRQKQIKSKITDSHKMCSRCRTIKPMTDFATKGKKFPESWCRKCHKEDQQPKREEQRLRIIKHYSDGAVCCACCGETKIEFLAVDHIGGGGSKHVRSIRAQFYRWLEKNNYPEGFRILCHNCNMAIRFGSPCPHEAERQRDAFYFAGEAC